MKVNLKFGFTLTELLIVLGIMLLLAGIILSTFVTFRQNESLSKDSELVIQVLRQARSQTMSSRNSSQYGVHFNLKDFVIFSGNIYDLNGSDNQSFKFSSDDTTLITTLSGGGSDVIFERLSGETSQNGTISVSSQSTGKTKSVTIYKTGLIDTQ